MKHAQNTSDVLVETLYQWGVRMVFGMPGDGINGVIEALRKRKGDIRFIQVRHEEAAAFMATAYAKLTGKLGVCLATSGPGGIHLLNGLYDAKLDGAPVLAITGMQFHDLLNTHTQQDVELDKLFQDVALYSTRVMGPAHIENVAELACRTALSRKGVAHITIPVDLQEAPVAGSMRSDRNRKSHVSNIPAFRAGMPAEAELAAAAEILNRGRRTVIMAGRGAIGAGDKVLAVAEKLGAVIVKPLLGKSSVPDDSPYCTGAVGLLGTGPSQEALEDCDTLLIVGSSFPYIEFYPKPGQVKCVQIDSDPVRIGLRHPADAGLVGDAGKTLEMLLPMLERRENRRFLEKAHNHMLHWRAVQEKSASVADIPMKPQVVVSELNGLLSDDAIILCDSGSIASWFARYIDIRAGQSCTLSGTLASMACGLPYANAAQLAFPDRQVVAIVGDGGFSMLMAEMITAKKYNLPVKILVMKNGELGQIKWEQMGMNGNPEYGCELEPFDFVKFAEACGIAGYRITDPRDANAILGQALADSGPALIEAVIDPNEMPIPPRVTFRQMEKFARALERGTPDGGKIFKELVKQKARQLV